MPGEAFQAISPNGTRYWLDYLVYKQAASIGDGSDENSLGRAYASMLVTREEDRFGNWLKYYYTNGIINLIEASDGRRVVINNNSVDITSITIESSSGNREWKYEYNSGSLTNVILPDGSSWKFSLGNFYKLNDTRPASFYLANGGNCYPTFDNDGMTGDEISGSITSPIGANAKFLLGLLHTGRSYVPKTCTSYFGTVLSAEYPKDNWDYAIKSKIVSGPGLISSTWNYSYSPGNSSWSSDCASGCVSTVWTDVTDPEGVRHRSIFSNRFDGTENLLLRNETYTAGSGALVRAVDYTYAITPAVESNSPYPWRSVGGDFTTRSNGDISERWTPSLSTKITQEGKEFLSSVNSYDTYARPLSVTHSSPSNTRADTTAYYDNTAKWILIPHITHPA